MARRFRLDFSTAYGQLILLVFLPISLLAIVGGMLVLYDTSRAARITQKATADTLLNQYQSLANASFDDLQRIEQSFAENVDKKQKSTLTPDERHKKQQAILQQFQAQISNRHLQGIVIVNEQGQILLSSGDIYPLSDDANSRDSIVYQNIAFKKTAFEKNTVNADFVNDLKDFFNQQVIFGQSKINRFIDHVTAQDNYLIDTNNGTIYAKPLIFNNHQDTAKLWIMVNVDNEPLKIARYQVILALAVTGLFTILLLLLSIHIYARRWISPIYEMRMHLQRTNAHNLYKPMTVKSTGEISLLQQDLVKTLRRLHSSFQELKNHAEQTEDDLRLAFDEVEMQNIAMRNAHDAAVSASQTKSAFLANISHELRTPLNSIDGFINLLSRHGGLTHEQDLYVQTIRKSSAHLLALVNDVLDFSKIEAGKLILDSHEVDLYATIYDVVDMLSPVAAEKGLRLAVYFYDDVPRYLLGDALRIKQVLTNLVNNAIKFTETGEVVVRVSLDDAQDDALYISVQDTGRGIDPAHQKLLFQSFSQGDPSITRQYGGTGLGLIISKQLTNLMGGKIGFFANDKDSEEADPATGSTFWFTLPMDFTPRQRQLIHASMQQIWEIPNSLINQHEKPLQLLVWIDHEASLQILRGSLRQLNVVITLAKSLADLSNFLTTSKHWDWVIVDKSVSDDTTVLLKQIRLHYAGKLALFGYHVNLDPELLNRFHIYSLYQPLDRRQLYQLLDNNQTTTIEPVLPKWEGVCALAVDDHLPNLLVLQALLEELGVDVVTANSGFEAIEYMRNSLNLNQQENHDYRHIDLIFMDIQMPKMSGRQASVQIRQLETLAYEQTGKKIQTPIIALTAHSLSDERDKLLAAGINDYVGKPIIQPKLIQVLEHWLNPHETGENPLQQPDQPDEQKLIDKTPNTQDVNEDLAVIDWQDALNRVAGKTQLASNLLNMLIESAPKEKAEITQAWQEHDRESVANIAHRILGASRYTGVPQLRHASQALEDKCLLNINNTSPAQIALLTPYFEQMIKALDNLIAVDVNDYPMLKQDIAKENDMAWKMI